MRDDNGEYRQIRQVAGQRDKKGSKIVGARKKNRIAERKKAFDCFPGWYVCHSAFRPRFGFSRICFLRQFHAPPVGLTPRRFRVVI